MASCLHAAILAATATACAPGARLSSPAAVSPSVGLPRAAPEEVGLSSAALERVTEAMQSHVDSGRVAGMVLVVARHGRIGYARALGYADIENRIPLRTDAVFRLASIRKPLLAAAALVLVDAGKMKLDDPVARYIPSFRDVQVYDGGSATNPVLRRPGRPITVRHLLTHTSGLATGYLTHPVDSIYRRVGLQRTERTLAGFADGLARIPLEFSPGDAWRYSRSFEVVGRVLEVASGQPLDRYLAEAFFAPLGMEGSFFAITPAIEDRVPVQYARDASSGTVRATSGEGRTGPLPTGTMVSTPADFMRFGQMLLNRGVLDGTRVLAQESVDELIRNQLPPSLTPIATPLWDHQGYGFGLGGAVRVEPATTEAPESPGTYRWPGSSGTFFWVDPRADLVALIWTQSSTGYWLEHEFQRLVYHALER